jgi:type II secretory pathway component PulF
MLSRGEEVVDPREILGSLLAPRARIGELRSLAYDLGLALDAGVDLRVACRREATRARNPVLKRYLERVARAVETGNSFHEALKDCNGFFPPFFVELVTIGELTGQLPETLLELSRRYEEVLARRRAFRSVIVSPVIQLVIALTVIGLLIWLLGVIGDPYNPVFDPLGLGVVGTPGVVRYLGLLALIASAIGIGVYVLRQGFTWIWPLQKLLLRIPVVGPALETLLISEISWALARTLGVGMDVQKAVQLSLGVTRHGQYLEQIGPINRAIEAGQSIAEAFRDTRAFPDYLLDVLETGEATGRLPEALDHLCEHLRERAIHTMKVLAVVAGWIIWLLIAMVIIFFIFRLFSFYLGILQGAGSGI